MLQKLQIKNFALIDELTFVISPELNIITGETGAGKSIILGALALILGNRAEANVLFDKEKKCFVEGTFQIRRYKLKTFFETHGLDYDDQTIVRREISLNGKSRAFINDSPVTLNVLRDLTSQLVDLHTQHETLELNDKTFQIRVLDDLANHENLIRDFSAKLKEYKFNNLKLQQLIDQNEKATRDLDYFQFQLKELTENELEEIKQNELEDQIKIQSHAEEIKNLLAAILTELSNQEKSVIDNLEAISFKMNELMKFSSSTTDLKKRLESVQIELKDIADDLVTIQESTSYDPEMIISITEKLDLLYRLEKKHHVNSVEQLIEIRNDLENKVNTIGSLIHEIEILQNEIAAQKKQLKEIGLKIHVSRNQQIKFLEESVNRQLKDLGMPSASLKVNLELTEEFSETGMDQVSFLFSANKGSAELEISKVASGGELSRLMLAIKSLIAESTALPTMIFDEIDSGVSGETAKKVGALLQKAGKNHQVLCITHLPQIASKGSKHFLVYKKDERDRTYTYIKELNRDERIVEIAKMLSGAKPTPAALKNAEELILS